MKYKDVSAGIFKILGIAGFLIVLLVKLVHLVCFKSVGALYKSKLISGSKAGKLCYFLFFVTIVGGIAVGAMYLA